MPLRPSERTDAIGHVPALDGIRGLAILLVMATHFTIIEKGPLIDEFVAAIGRFGWCGVDLFFVLSGFLITGILYDSKGSNHYFRSFYARRTLRIFPLYYVVLFLTLVVLPLLPATFADRFGHIGNTAPFYWLYLSNYPIAFTNDINHRILAVTWSLAIEEQFYLFWPLLVAVCRRETLIKICFAAIVVALVSRTALVLAGADPAIPYNLTFCRWDGLAMGALVALAVRGEPAGASALVPRARLIGLLSFFLVVVILLIQRRPHWDGGVGLCIGCTVLAALFASILIIALARPRGRGASFLSQRWLRTLGKYSYAMYLFHLPIRVIVQQYIYPPHQFLTIGSSRLLGQMIFAAICCGLTLSAAIVSWYLLEKRFLALKRFFPAERATAAQVPAIVPHEADEEAPLQPT